MIGRGGGIVCPSCGHQTGVVDSRASGDMIRRRRCCEKCATRFTTFEIAFLDINSIHEFHTTYSLAHRLRGELDELPEAPRRLIEQLIKTLARTLSQSNQADDYEGAR